MYHNCLKGQTKDAVSKIVAVGGFLSENAERIVGDIDGLFIESNGIDIRVDLGGSDGCPMVGISESFLVVK